MKRIEHLSIDNNGRWWNLFLLHFLWYQVNSILKNYGSYIKDILKNGFFSDKRERHAENWQ